MSATVKKLQAVRPVTAIKNLKSITKDSKDENTIPKGSDILKKDVNVTVEEIENGFIITKSFDIKYQAPNKEYTDYCYFSKKWYSETNPLSIDTQDKSLADLFEE